MDAGKISPLAGWEQVAPSQARKELSVTEHDVVQHAEGIIKALSKGKNFSREVADGLDLEFWILDTHRYFSENYPGVSSRSGIDLDLGSGWICLAALLGRNYRISGRPDLADGSKGGSMEAQRASDRPIHRSGERSPATVTEVRCNVKKPYLRGYGPAIGPSITGGME